MPWRLTQASAASPSRTLRPDCTDSRTNRRRGINLSRQRYPGAAPGSAENSSSTRQAGAPPLAYPFLFAGLEALAFGGFAAAGIFPGPGLSFQSWGFPGHDRDTRCHTTAGDYNDPGCSAANPHCYRFCHPFSYRNCDSDPANFHAYPFANSNPGVHPDTPCACKMARCSCLSHRAGSCVDLCQKSAALSRMNSRSGRFIWTISGSIKPR